MDYFLFESPLNDCKVALLTFRINGLGFVACSFRKHGFTRCESKELTPMNGLTQNAFAHLQNGLPEDWAPQFGGHSETFA